MLRGCGWEADAGNQPVNVLSCFPCLTSTVRCLLRGGHQPPEVPLSQKLIIPADYSPGVWSAGQINLHKSFDIIHFWWLERGSKIHVFDLGGGPGGGAEADERLG